MGDPDVKDWERLQKWLDENPRPTAPVEEDVVNNPSHYNKGGIECIESKSICGAMKARPSQERISKRLAGT
jgi:hypothetical protein